MINYCEKDLDEELKKCFGETASFYPGQKEAIKAVLDGKRTLVVQKTGWGKSLVYFMATAIMRKYTSKMALIISPLLVLMDNQIESAQKMGLNVKTINSLNQDENDEIIEEVLDGKVDALIISPERLGNDKFRKQLLGGAASQIGLFVIDEAHCISDWGHDFRPDYRRIADVLRLLPANIPILATTATANDRVVNDIKAQLGVNLYVSRGSLMRESIAIQTIYLNSREEKLAWMAKNINKIPGTGIVYCLTVNDCKLVSRWFESNGIACKPYYADLGEDDKKEAERLFANNQIKVLAATVAFGMGYDKPDIGFVIHFQKPGNVVAYYQQIGRAGRKIPKAYAILLYGEDDDLINEYFIKSAFPTEKMMNKIVDTIINNPGVTKRNIQQYADMKYTQIEKCLKYLEVEGDIYIDNSKYYKTPKPWKPDLDRSNQVTAIRIKELDTMNQFVETKGCYMEFIAKELNDVHAHACGKCSNCAGHDLFDGIVTKEDVIDAQQFIKSDFHVIKPRKQWPDTVCSENGKLRIEPENLVEEGLVLSNYGDAGWGREVSEDKYKHGEFREELVTVSSELLQKFIIEHDIKALTYIPSHRRPSLVKNFAEKLAEKLNLEFFCAIEKIEDAECQKYMNNSYSQWKNANDSFGVLEVRKDNILLVDDMVDSGWTFTCCGIKMRKAGSGKIYPFALANSTGKGNETL